MAKDPLELVTIMRNVTGRLDRSDPQYTDEIMLGFLADFIELESSQEIRINELYGWWDFDIDPATENPLPVDLQAPFGGNGQQYTTIGPLVYIDGFRCWWYQDPGAFFARWPDTQLYQPTRPLSVLYYNNELTFRNPPDRQYRVRISAYRVNQLTNPDSQSITSDYLYRYFAYGASRNVFADAGELDQWREYEPVFRDYKAKVYARTYQQNMNQRSTPSF